MSERALGRRVGARLRRLVLSSCIGIAAALGTAHAASAFTVGIELLACIDGQSCPQPTSTAFGGPDASTNTPLDLAVAGGETIDVFVLIDFGVPIRQYETVITLNDADLSFVPGSAVDETTLGFSPLADPNDTLTDGTPGTGDADSNLCPPGTCTAYSGTPLYLMSFVVGPTFSLDALRDLTVTIEAITFDSGGDDLDPARDTASLRLVLVPEPGTALLVAGGLLGLALRRREGTR